MAMLASPKQLSLKIAPREETKNHKTMEALLVNITHCMELFYSLQMHFTMNLVKPT